MFDVSGHEDALGTIDGRRLTPIVRAVLANQSAEVVDWRYRALQQVTDADIAATAEDAQREAESPASEAVRTLRAWFDDVVKDAPLHRGVFRFEGTARISSRSVSWSAILKIQGGSRREYHAFRSGILDDLPPTLGIPACYDAEDRPGGSYWLWLEDVRDDIGNVWPIERFGVAARHLAHFNGPYLLGKPLPDESWLGRKPSLRWDETERMLAQVESIKDHPLVARAFTPENARGIRRLWEERHVFTETLARIPSTFGHLDAQRSNLVARASEGEDRTVAIDWGGIGIGTLGMEIAQLAVNFRSVRDVDLGQLKPLNDLVFDSYLDGLRDVGWTGNPKLLRLGYMASIALQNGLSDFWSLRGAVYPDGYPRMRLLWGDRSIEVNMDRRGELLGFILTCADEARSLIDDPDVWST